MTSPILKRHRMLKPPDKKAANKPFLVDETIGQPHDTLANQALSSAVPINQQTLKIASRYRDKELPVLLEDPLKKTRTFFLTELTPIILAVSNGLIEAREVLMEAFEEEPDTGPYTRRIEELAYQAAEVKMISFIEKLFSLNPEEAKRFLIGIHAKELKSDDLAAVLGRIVARDNQPPKEDHPKQTQRIKRKKGKHQ